MLWEPEHGGTLATAVHQGASIYWNAPTREDDVQGQIAMVEHVTGANYQGLILSPDHALALVTPVRRTIEHGVPTVVLGSPLAMPAGNDLWYILNDEDIGGRMAAERVAALLHAKGTIAVLGIDPDIIGIVDRARSFEQYLAEHYPEIHVVANQSGSFNLPHEQQVAEETLKEHPDIDAIVSMNATSTHGVLSAIGTASATRIKVLAFDPDSLAFDNPSLDSLILEDTRRMGVEAVRVLLAHRRGESSPAVMKFAPVLVTRENVNSPEVNRLTSMDWRPSLMRWKWSVGP